MLRARECAPIFSSFVVFTFRVIVEFFKELGGVSFIVIKHENVNKKGTEKGYGTRSYFKLVLNKLKIMRS
jgi:hypothetical protein